MLRTIAPVLAFGLVTAVTCGAFAGCPSNAPNLDTQIKLLTYQGDPGSFESFRYIMRVKFGRMADQLTRGGMPDLSGLSLSPAVPDTLQTRADVKTFMDAHPEFLTLWRGAIETSGGVRQAISDIFLGRFKGDLRQPDVALSIPIEANNAASTLDSHSMVVLYALAVNANTSKCSPDVVKALLDRALMSYDDLKQRGLDSDNDIRTVGAAITSMSGKRALTGTP